MSRKIHKVHIALTNNNIDTTGAVSRDTISVQLKNFENFVFQKNLMIMQHISNHPF